MQTLTPVEPASTTGKTKWIFDKLQKSLGTVPNLMRTLGTSPAALNAYVSFNAALSDGKLPTALREQIAIAVANVNSCEYCLSAHNALGKLAGLSAADLYLTQKAEAHDAKSAAALSFAVEIVRKRGLLATPEIEKLRAAGYSDEEIVEIVAAVAINIFTNYFNHIAGTEIDFPVVQSSR